ncbi:hypothetical protein V6N13_109449 [Hibiscus sabdariffa]|uniref:NAC domain-containing protein n=1 Tax=Hibiscus sabdariffa TaxID=183260 RepID=A0ABR2FPP9_9ROSI
MADIIGEEDDQNQMDLPPGFRFHPTDEELISHYLYNKVVALNFTAKAIGEVDLNKSEPWDLPYEGKAKMGEKEWYFFCMRDRKYPTGMRTNRATESGYWKATGKDKEIFRGKSLVGMKKTLVFYRGRAPKGEKTNWIMHEYRLDGKFSVQNLPKSAKNEWVICRIFQKSCSGKKTLLSDPSLMETSSTNGKTRGFPDSTTAYVPCFSNPTDFQTNKQDTDAVAVADRFNSVLLPVPRNSPNILPNPFFSFPGTFLIQNRPILKALVDNHGPNMKIDTGRSTTDINNAEISGEAFNMDCFWRF